MYTIFIIPDGSDLFVNNLFIDLDYIYTLYLDTNILFYVYSDLIRAFNCQKCLPILEKVNNLYTLFF